MKTLATIDYGAARVQPMHKDRLMNVIAESIGWSFLISAVLGAVLPGLNFHVLLGNDESALHWHKEATQKLEKRMNKKKGETNE